MKADGGPAFPAAGKERIRLVADGVFDPDDPRNFAVADAHYRGMSLRDYFAGQALIAVHIYENTSRLMEAVVNQNDDADTSSTRAMAEYAYNLADAMLKAREAA